MIARWGQNGTNVILKVCLPQFKTDEGEEQLDSIQKNKHNNPIGFTRWLLDPVTGSYSRKKMAQKNFTNVSFSKKYSMKEPRSCNSAGLLQKILAAMSGTIVTSLVTTPLGNSNLSVYYFNPSRCN